MRKCDKCLKIKSLDCFHKLKSNIDGLKKTCKECISIQRKHYYKKHNKKIRANSKQYYLNNVEKCRVDMKEYNTKNRKHILALKKDWLNTKSGKKSNKKRLKKRRKEYMLKKAAAEKEMINLAVAKEKEAKKNNYKYPMAALTLTQAKIRGVKCIPLESLFDFRRELLQRI